MTFDSTDQAYVFLGKMAIDADGSPHAYAPKDSGLKPLDYLANAGHSGNWWGIETDTGERDGTPILQGVGDVAPGYYISTTTYRHRQFPRIVSRHNLNSETELFIVVTAQFRREAKGVVIGCKAIVSYRGRSVTAIVGDVGPAFGEASIAVANALGIPSNPKTGGVDSDVEYRIYPGVVVPGYELQRIS